LSAVQITAFIRVLEILLHAQRRVEHFSTLVHPGPGNRLAVSGSILRGYQQSDIRGEVLVLIEFPIRSERLHVFENRMIFHARSD
jgi:hypothetical protein